VVVFLYGSLIFNHFIGLVFHMNQEDFDKLVEIKKQMEFHQLEVCRLKKIEEDYYRENIAPLIVERGKLSCDHINPDGTSAIISNKWGCSCAICGIENDYLWYLIERNPNHPINKKKLKK